MGLEDSSPNIQGATDNTYIGNEGDSLKTVTKVQDGSGTPITSTLVSGKQAFDVNVVNSFAAGTADKSTFTYGTTVDSTIGGVYQDTSPTLTAGQQGAVRVTQNRALHTNLRNNSGTEIATSSNPLRIDPTGTTSQPVKLHDTSDVGITSTSYVGKQLLDVSANLASGSQLDAMQRLRVSDTSLIETLHFFNTAHPLLMNTAVTGSGALAFNQATSSARLTTTTSATDSVIFQTRRYFRYDAGHSYLFTAGATLGAKKVNTRQRIGYFDSNNGVFFEQIATDIKVVVRTNSSGSPVDTSVSQINWNLDTLDGNGSSGINLDLSKNNIFVIDYLWADGFRFGIIYNNKVVYCHAVLGSNVSSNPLIRTPTLPMRIELVNTGAVASTTTADLNLFSYQKESSDTVTGPYSFSATTARTSKNVGSTVIPIMSIRPKATFNGVTNRVPIIPNEAIAATSSQITIISIILNPTLTGASWVSADSNSAVEYDITATALTGGTTIKQFYVAASNQTSSAVAEILGNSIRSAILGLDIPGTGQDILCLAAQSTAGGSPTFGIMTWQEFQ